MKLPDGCSAQVGGSRPRAKAGFTLVEAMVASGIMAVVLAGAMTFMSFAGVSVSGITAQNVASGQAANAIELIQSRVRFATSISNNASGNSLTLGFDDNYAVDSDGDGKPYNDKNHFERFMFTGVNSTNTAACSSNRLVYVPNLSSTGSRVLVPKGVRNLPKYNIFTVTNGATAIIRFGIVDGNGRDYYQAVEIQGTAVSLNRPATTNFISILP
jgi:prepilin-type N-terminal cleavage/methylation domain-containing protein